MKLYFIAAILSLLATIISLYKLIQWKKDNKLLLDRILGLQIQGKQTDDVEGEVKSKLQYRGGRWYQGDELIKDMEHYSVVIIFTSLTFSFILLGIDKKFFGIVLLLGAAFLFLFVYQQRIFKALFIIGLLAIPLNIMGNAADTLIIKLGIEMGFAHVFEVIGTIAGILVGIFTFRKVFEPDAIDSGSGTTKDITIMKGRKPANPA